MPVRIQRKRAKGWRMPPNTVNCTRPGRWSNPFRVRPAESSGGVTIPAIDATQAVVLYRHSINQALLADPDLLDPLRGKNLMCWCALSDPCHTDVQLDLANRDLVAEADAACAECRGGCGICNHPWPHLRGRTKKPTP